MKRFALLVALVAVTLVAGPAWGQWQTYGNAPCAIVCPPGAGVGETVTAYLLDEEGNVLTRQDHLDAGFYWCFFTIFTEAEGEQFVDGPITEVMLEDGGIEHTVAQDWLDASDDNMYTEGGGAFWIGVEDPGNYMVATWGAEGGGVATLLETGVGGDNCAEGAGCEGGAPAVSASITGPHNVDVGAEVVLEVVTEGLDEGTETYLWDDDSTAATRDLGVVDGGDTGVYTCEVGGDVDGEALEEPIEASFTLWVGVATPLAGGLGLGLLAGACALAGAVSIRRKK